MRSALWALSLAVASSAVASPAAAESVQVAQARKPAKKSAPKKKKASPKRKAAPRQRALGNFELGLSGGVNIANMSGEDTTETETKLGFNAGLDIYYTFPALKQLQVQSGLIYSTRGYSLETVTGNNTRTQTDTFSYIDIPAMLRFAFSEGKLKPFVHGGLYVGILVSSEREDEVAIADGDTIRKNSVTSEIEGASGFDAGFQLGAGVQYDFGPGVSAVARLQYQRSLTDPIDETNGQSDLPEGAPEGAAAGQNTAQVHSNIGITAGFVFRF